MKELNDNLNLEIILTTFFTWFLVSLLILIEFSLFIIPSIILTILFDMKHKRILFWLTKFFIRLFFKVYLIGDFKINLNNIKSNSPRIYMLNHASQFDTFLMYLLPGSFKVLVKKAYTKIPFIGWSILLTGNVLVKKMESDFEESNIIQDAIKKIRGGDNLVIFPEGTKSKSGSVARFRTGGFKIAYETKSEIVPIVLDTWNSIRPGGGAWIRDDKSWMKVLDPIKFDDYKNIEIKEFARSLRFKISEELLKIRDIRRKTEKKYYRNMEKYKKLDDELYQKLMEYKKNSAGIAISFK